MRTMKIRAAKRIEDEAGMEIQKANIIDSVVNILFTKASGLSKDLVDAQKRKMLLKFDYIDAIEALYEFCNAAMYREHKIRSMHAYLSNIIKRRENNPSSVSKMRHIQKRKANNRIKRIRALKQDSLRSPVDECRSILNRLSVSEAPPQIDIPSYHSQDSRASVGSPEHRGHCNMSMGSTSLGSMSMGSTPADRLTHLDGSGSCRSSSSMDQPPNQA